MSKRQLFICSICTGLEAEKLTWQVDCQTKTHGIHTNECYTSLHVSMSASNPTCMSLEMLKKNQCE